jgi:hypothetical protein
MQTFLPYKNFKKSARCLDRQRLGKQRVEGYQILRVLLGIGKRNKNGNLAWENHPAVKMWKGHEIALVAYVTEMCTEWIRRGYKDTILEKIDLLLPLKMEVSLPLSPRWLGNKEFHASHRSNLLRKNKVYYSKFNWKEPDNLPYYWPINKENK